MNVYVVVEDIYGKMHQVHGEEWSTSRILVDVDDGSHKYS